MYRWLLDQGVRFEFSTEVTDIDFVFDGDRKQATRIHWTKGGVPGGVDLGPDDLVLATIGSLTENSDDGTHHNAARLDEGPARAWDLWRRIAAKHSSFANDPSSLRRATRLPSRQRIATTTRPRRLAGRRAS